MESYCVCIVSAGGVVVVLLGKKSRSAGRAHMMDIAYGSTDWQGRAGQGRAGWVTGLGPLPLAHYLGWTQGGSGVGLCDVFKRPESD